MKVLFVSSPALGLLFPLIQLAWGFRTNGHEVLIATAADAARAAASGHEVVDVAQDYSTVAVFDQVARDNPAFATTVATRPVFALEEWAVLIAAVNRPLIDGLIWLTDDWQPDLVVYEQSATAGLIAAARARVPAIQRNQSAWRTRGMHDAIAGFLPDLLEKHGIARQLPKPRITIESFPPSMLVEGKPEGWFMRWVPYGGGTILNGGPRQGPRPLVAVTMGTHELQAFGVGAVKLIVAAAARVEADFVLALGDVDAAPLGPLPANVRSVGWVSLHRLLRDCTAVVHHGGGGTMLTAIEAGTPQLLAPDARDMFSYTGRRAVLERGIGLVSTADEVTPDLITSIIGDERFARETAIVREEMIGLATPAETVRRILAEV